MVTVTSPISILCDTNRSVHSFAIPCVLIINRASRDPSSSSALLRSVPQLSSLPPVAGLPGLASSFLPSKTTYLAFYMMAQHSTHCYHCGSESVDNTFKYYNNGKRTQPRYQCSKCQKFFTLGSQGYPEGRSYAKKRNVDPPELKDLPRECRCCGVADNAPFKYYNNKNLSQPRFKCLSCGQQFQMRLMGIGEERRLVHTMSYQRPPNNQKLGLASNSDNEICAQTSMDPWMPVLEEGNDFPTLSVADARYLDLIEAGLKHENEAPPPEAVLRLQLWASKLPQRCC